jgi:hypothetical protein
MPVPDDTRISNLQLIAPPSTNMGNIALINDPSNTLTVTSATSAWTALEANYQGASGRQAFTTPAGGSYSIVTSPSRLAKVTARVTFNNTSGGSSIIFTHAILISGSTIKQVWDMPGSTIAAGQSKDIDLSIAA